MKQSALAPLYPFFRREKQRDERQGGGISSKSVMAKVEG